MIFIGNNTILTEVDGKKYKVNTSTGEATEMISLLVPLETKTWTPHQQKAARDWAEMKKRIAEQLAKYMN